MLVGAKRGGASMSRPMAWVLGWAVMGCSAPTGGDGEAVVITHDAGPSDAAADGQTDRADSVATDSAVRDAVPPDAAPPPRCPTEGPAWQRGQPIFENATERWGLLGVEGEYLSVTDIDGDGWPDLLSR